MDDIPSKRRQQTKRRRLAPLVTLTLGASASGCAAFRYPDALYGLDLALDEVDFAERNPVVIYTPRACASAQPSAWMPTSTR